MFFICCFISQWMKRSKHGLFVFPPKKTNQENQSCCSIDVKAEYRLISRNFSGMNFFHPSVCLTKYSVIVLTGHTRLPLAQTSYTAVFSVVTQRSSLLTAAENRTTFLSLCVCGLTNKPIMYKKFDNT